MTITRSGPHAKRRWLLLSGAVGAMTLMVGSLALAVLPDPLITTIPAGYFTVTDSDGANDVPAQSDLTQMGRDDADPNVYKLFWSWDETDQWTGSGQTGDACALFDSDGDTKINFVVCARVSNTNADTTVVELVPQDATRPVYMFTCSDAKNDRCTQPSAPLLYDAPTQGDAGVLGTRAKANLITGTDPFGALGSDTPLDSTIEVWIAKSILPNVGSTLVNVCSYPSAGNGGNNNPFDCVVNPGGGFLVIAKNAGTAATSPTFSFSATKNTTTLGTRQINGTGSAASLSVSVGSSPIIVTETSIPANWDLTGVTCSIQGVTGTTGTFDNAGDRVTGVAIQSGKTTTCTFTDVLTVGSLTLVKRVVNDNGGSKTATDSGVTSSAGTVTFGTGEADGASTLKYTSNTFTVTTGSYTFSESNVAGYTEGTWACTGATATGTAYNAGSVTVPGGGSVTCTITNNDDQGSLTLVKRVVNDNGGTKVASDFGVTSNAGTVTFGSGEADGTNTLKYTSTTMNVDAGSKTLRENDVAGYTEGTWSCSPTAASNSTITAGAVTVGNGVAVTCTITNNDDQGSLTLVKRVVNDNGGTATAASFGITTSAGTPIFGAGVVDGTTTVYTSNTMNVDAGSKTLRENDIAGYTEGTWSCSPTAASNSTITAGVVTVGNGAAVTCTITNNDEKAQPSGATTQSWILHDSIAINNIRPGGSPAAGVTFRLYTTCTAGTPSGLVGTETDTTIVGGAASTTNGIAVTASGFYHWTAEYSGDSFNEAFTTSCSDEITEIVAKDAFGTPDRDDFAPQ